MAEQSMPILVDWKSSFKKENGGFILNVSVPSDLHNQMLDIDLFPATWGIVKTTSDVTTEINDDGTITFSAQADERDLASITNASFVIQTGNKAYEVNANLDNSLVQTSQPYGLLFILGFAFIGGGHDHIGRKIF